MSSVSKWPAGRLAAAVCAAVLGGAAPTADAESYRLQSPGDSVIGTPFYLPVHRKDTLLDVARQNNLGFDDMRLANPDLDMWVPGEGAEAMVPTFFVLPDAPQRGIVINVAEKRLYYYPPDRADEVHTYSISVGREEMQTPLGDYHIIEKKKDPSWTPGPSVRAAHAADGDILPAVVPPGPDNPLGQFAMRLSNPEYLIHGTSKPWGMGLEVSAGCIRMYPEGVEKLFAMASVDTSVKIVDQPYKVGWRGDELYLEVNREEKNARKPVRSIIPESVADMSGVQVDWSAVRRADEENSGIPQLVGRRSNAINEPYLLMIF